MRKIRDPVSLVGVRAWCDAMEDGNPVYTDPEAAACSLHGGLVAPPAMLDSWAMPGNVPRPAGRGELGERLAKLDDEGFTSVVATESVHEYERYLRPGDDLSVEQQIVSLSDEKQTALGVGRFLTTSTEYRDASGASVGRMRFTILKFKPGTGRAAGGQTPEAAAQPPARRPRPGVIQETRFFWEGCRAGELRIQQCGSCGRLAHPPGVRCPACGSYELGYRVASGRGQLYSFVEVQHPRVPAFDYPLLVALVELKEGTRLLANLEGVEPDDVQVGMPLECFFREVEPGFSLPFFRPARPPRRERTLRYAEVEVGDALPLCPVPITATLIVAGAMASRDFQDVHHDRDAAIRRGTPDIFMNIMTTGGLVSRYVGDWAGPEARFERMALRLGVPNHPGDLMTLRGEVVAKERRAEEGCVALALRGHNRRGDHVTARVTLALPLQTEPTPLERHLGVGPS